MDEGRKICWVPNEKVPMTLVKTGGGYTYDTSDMAAVHHRLFVEKAEWVLYVVDMGQVISIYILTMIEVLVFSFLSYFFFCVSEIPVCFFFFTNKE